MASFKPSQFSKPVGEPARPNLSWAETSFTDPLKSPAVWAASQGYDWVTGTSRTPTTTSTTAASTTAATPSAPTAPLVLPTYQPPVLQQQQGQNQDQQKQEQGEDVPFYKQSWFLPAVVITVSGAVAMAIVFWPTAEAADAEEEVA